MSSRGVSLIALIITIITITILFGIVFREMLKTNPTLYELERNQYCPTCGRRY